MLNILEFTKSFFRAGQKRPGSDTFEGHEKKYDPFQAELEKAGHPDHERRRHQRPGHPKPDRSRARSGQDRGGSPR